MENAKKNPTSVTVNAQYLKDLSFENPNAPFSFQDGEAPNFNMQFDLGAQQVNENLYEVALSFTIEGMQQEKKALIIEIKYAGLFTIHCDDKKELEMILLIQCPTLLFPYVRRIVSNLSTDAGYPPINLSPIDFYGFYISKFNEEQQAVANEAVN